MSAHLNKLLSCVNRRIRRNLGSSIPYVFSEVSPGPQRMRYCVAYSAAAAPEVGLTQESAGRA